MSTERRPDQSFLCPASRIRVVAPVAQSASGHPGGEGRILTSVMKRWDPHRWTYSVEETRNGLYEAMADDHQGTSVRRTAWCATDAEIKALLRAVEHEANEITRRRREAADGR